MDSKQRWLIEEEQDFVGNINKANLEHNNQPNNLPCLVSDTNALHTPLNGELCANKIQHYPLGQEDVVEGKLPSRMRGG
eukprot:13047648-Ditylum_brightwellii.AAC.1